jgi:tripartite-type tricarboxylate transporter receptor subunit TctC
MNITRRVAAALLALGTSGFGAAAHAADDYPSKPLKLIVAYPPGQSTDIVSRYLGAKLAEELGQPVYIDNKGGASGNLGTAYAARQPADGYSLLMGTSGTHVMNEFLFANIGFNPDKDFEPIAPTVIIPMMIAVHPSVPANNLPELLALARSKPGKIDVAIPSVTARLVLESLRPHGAPFFGVPYSGSGAAATAVLGNHVPVIIDTAAATRGQIGKLKPIAVTSAKSMRSLPEIKSVAEQGIADFDISAWNALMVPAGTPEPVKQKLAAAMKKIMALPETTKALQDLGFEPAPYMSPTDTLAFSRASRKTFGDAIRAAGLKPE